jgi:hypothetical protein
MVLLVLALLVSLLGSAFQTAAAADGAALSIVSVSKGVSVTVSVENMPANKEFRVLMNKIGTQGAGGTSAGTGKTNSDGSFTKTFSIPAALKNEAKIAIRVEATDKTGWYAYNWFTNNTSGSSSSSSGGSSVPQTGASSSGSFSILDVEEDDSVSILVKNLPANRQFAVWFDWKNRSSVVKGVQAGTVRSDGDGEISTTLDLPAAVRDRHEVRVRLQSTSGSSVSAYIWFLNSDSDEEAGGSAPSGSLGIPYLVIGSVVEDETVTVTIHNFPARTELDVYMGKYGTQGEDGIYVDTVKTGKTGPLTVTLDIPNKLEGRENISIRVEATDDSDHYAFDWFTNNPD